VSSLFSSALSPFVLATIVLLGVAVAEALALLIGASASHWLEGVITDADHPDGFAEGALGWLHIGKVPLLAILVIFLTTFAVSGFGLQLAAMRAVGHYLPTLLAVGLALLFAVFAVRVLGAVLGQVFPRDETTAVADASLVGRVGTVVIGTARAGRAAQTRIHDEHGTVHYVMVEPEGPDESLEAGASVLLVRHLSGRRFQGIHNPKPEL
jgi:hypothetical protein